MELAFVGWVYLAACRPRFYVASHWFTHRLCKDSEVRMISEWPTFASWHIHRSGCRRPGRFAVLRWHATFVHVGGSKVSTTPDGDHLRLGWHSFVYILFKSPQSGPFAKLCRFFWPKLFTFLLVRYSTWILLATVVYFCCLLLCIDCQQLEQHLAQRQESMLSPTIERNLRVSALRFSWKLSILLKNAKGGQWTQKSEVLGEFLYILFKIRLLEPGEVC